MNLTATDYNNALQTNADFITLCDQYTALCTANGLPLSVDMPMLATVLQTQLFDKLLSIDKGLRMRYDLLKSDTAKLKLIAETIDLDGYDIVDELRELADNLSKQYRTLHIGGAWLRDLVTFDQFATVAKLDLSTLLQSYVLDWTGKEHVLAYLQNLAPMLRDLHAVFIAAGGERGTTPAQSMKLALSVVPNWFRTTETGELIADEHTAWRIAGNLQRAGKLDIVKK